MIAHFLIFLVYMQITVGESLTMVTILFAAIGGVWFLGKSFGQINTKLEKFKPEIDKIPDIDSKVNLMWNRFEEFLDNHKKIDG